MTTAYRATDAFIASTHEKYAAAFGGDLSAFDSLFTDEPSLMTLWMRPMPWGVLPYAAELVDAWRDRTGRSLDRDAPILALGANDENMKRLRYAFWDSVGRLVSANYMHRLDVWSIGQNPGMIEIKGLSVAIKSDHVGSCWLASRQELCRLRKAFCLGTGMSMRDWRKRQ